ncbi:MAG: YjjG family noncanonical pyrimidine nucleotidase [Draconibacterium sp.]
MNRKYTHIFFDLDNTLWDFETNSRNAMLISYEHFKLSQKADFNNFYEVYVKHNHKLWEFYRKSEIAKKELIQLRFQLTFDELSITGVDAGLMNTHYLDVMPHQKQLNDGAIELLKYLKKKSYEISIITNGFKEVQHKKIETSGLKPFITNVYISEELKISKPERGIFDYAIKSSNARKTKSLMVGDDWEADVIGAVKFGIDAVHFDRNETSELIQIENRLTKQCIYRTGALPKLIKIID